MLDNIYTLEINFTVDEETSSQETYYGQLEDGTLAWFTDCGEHIE